MAEFFKSVLVQDETPAADGTFTEDLPIRPLSHIDLTFKCLNAGANTKATLAQMLGALTKIEVLHFGSAVLSLSGVDLFALNCLLLKQIPMMGNIINTDDATRFITLKVPFGRRLFDPAECFPATRKGELTLKYTIDIAATGYDGSIMQIETIELPAASPRRHLKCTTLDTTPPATGEYDVDLPIGNLYLALLLWSATVPVTTAWTTTFDYLKFLVDNDEQYFGKTNWETLHNALMERIFPPVAWSEKIHLENVATAYAQSADTAGEEVVATDLEHHAYMDFDPLGDDSYIFDTKGKSSVKLRINAGDQTASRILPVELVAV